MCFIHSKAMANKHLIITILKSSSLSQQQQELDKQIMVSGQCEAEASN